MQVLSKMNVTLCPVIYIRSAQSLLFMNHCKIYTENTQRISVTSQAGIQLACLLVKHFLNQTMMSYTVSENWCTKNVPLLWFSLVDMWCLRAANTIHAELPTLLF